MRSPDQTGRQGRELHTLQYKTVQSKASVDLSLMRHTVLGLGTVYLLQSFCSGANSPRTWNLTRKYTRKTGTLYDTVATVRSTSFPGILCPCRTSALPPINKVETALMTRTTDVQTQSKQSCIRVHVT